jgi:hypothetical protein
MHNNRSSGSSNTQAATSHDLSGLDVLRTSGRLPRQEARADASDSSVLELRPTGRSVPSTTGLSAGSRAFDGLVRKCEWLDGVVRAAHSMLHEFHGQRATVQWNEGADIGYVIDWRSVVNYCSPDVLVVLLRDPTRLKVFDDFPKFALIPSLGECLDLQTENWFVEFSTRIANEQSDQTDVALNVLHQAASRLEPAKKENAMRVLATAKRLLMTNS